MEKPKKITVILYGVCAVIWILRVVFAVIEKEYHDSIFFFVYKISIFFFIRSKNKNIHEIGQKRENGALVLHQG